jgi:DNA-binding beta-propeller fold protein YncE
MTRSPAIAAALLVAVIALASAATAQPAASGTLELETRIALENVAGRIDHMAVDLARGRLFVAELGNDTVGVVDLKAKKLIRVIAGLKEPQGVGYVPATDTLYVANARDGTVQLFRGERYTPGDAVRLDSDADNIRADAATGQLFVGHGGGGLAVIDPASVSKPEDIPLPGHPESFQLARDARRIYVNVPTAGMVGVVDRATGRLIARWALPNMAGNFAMALDEARDEVIVAFRHPAKLVAFAMGAGGIVASADTCGDIDDVFVDAKRARLYASCGEGFVDVFDKASTPWRRLARVRTVAGARTSLFVPELDRLYVAVRASAAEPAAIWVFKPTP